MATTNHTQSQPPGGNVTYTWPTMPNGNDGQAANHTGSGDRTVQVLGTFGSGGTVVLEGSLNNVDWVTLRDAFGVALSFTAADIRSVIENATYVRPRVTAGDGATAVTVILNVRR